ncbi:MAG: hypothetical protein H6574_00035 [Lewinellaceae bacterium]|nr:hypothetical protein [Lewinellaceae bacterium]
MRSQRGYACGAPDDQRGIYYERHETLQHVRKAVKHTISTEYTTAWEGSTLQYWQKLTNQDLKSIMMINSNKTVNAIQEQEN